MLKISRFQVWLVQLSPTKGKEIHKMRPCVVVSPEEMASLSTIIVAPMTTKGFDYPFRVGCRFQGKSGLILLDQIRAVDKSRLAKRLGVISKSVQQELSLRLQEMFAY